MKLFDKFDEALWSYCVNGSMTEEQCNIINSMAKNLTEEQKDAAIAMAVADCNYSKIKGYLLGITATCAGIISGILIRETIRECIVPFVKMKVKEHKAKKAEKENNK